MGASNAVNRRLVTEMTKLQALATNTDPSSVKFIVDQSPIDAQGRPTNVSRYAQNIIIGRILPKSDIYKESAFQIEIKLPPEFPFRPPEVRFITPIYHPNVLEQGYIKIDEGWKPTTSLVDIVTTIVDLIDHPSPSHDYDFAIAGEYSSNKAEFDRKALAMVRRHQLPRN